MAKLSSRERREFIGLRLNAEWGWEGYQKQPGGYSYREMLGALARTFGVENVPSQPMTIRRDIDWLREQAALPDVGAQAEARGLLDPELFPEWRAKFFRVPETGEPFQTPKFQHAIFWVMHAATFKVPLPAWVIELLDELDPKHPFPDDINDLLTGGEESFLSFLLLLAPRHGKTELMVHFVLHTFATDQNKRVMFGNGTQKKSEGFIDNAIMSMLEGNDVSSQEFVDMFGPFRDKDRPWSKMGFTLAGREHSTKSYSLQPFGVSGNIRSFDADVILGDDLTDLKRARSETVTDEDYAWVTTELMLRREWQTSFVLTGSHVATQSGDLFTRFLSNLDRLNVGKQRLIVKTIPAHFYDRCDPVRDPLHNRCVLWPEGGRTYGFLEAQRAALNDDAMFEAVYNQIPQSQSMLHFPAEVLRSPFAAPVFTGDPSPPPQRDPDEPFGCLDYSRSWKDLPVVCCGKQAVVGLGFDPAASERKGASYSAVRVDAVCTLCARRYAVDHFKDRVSPEQHPALLEPFFDAYRPEIVTIEINAYQKALARDPRILKLQEKYRFEIKEFTTDERKHDPEFGIPQYGRHMKAGMYSIPYASVVDQEYAEPLLKAYIRWPQKPNDEVMAGWLCDLGLQELLEASRYLQAELMPGSERWATDFHTESTVTFDLSQAEPDEWVYA